MNGSNTFKYFFVSYGGVGAHMMLDIFKNVEMVNIDSFQKHHIKTPPKSFGTDTKVVYLYGDPYNAILSYFRRRKQEYITWTKKHCENIRGDYKKMDINWDVKDYLKNGEDLFKLEEHFDNWTNVTEKDYEICTFKYEDTPNNIEKLYGFLDIIEPKHKTPFKPRRSDWRNEDQETKELLKNMYGAFYEKYDNHPSFNIY